MRYDCQRVEKESSKQWLVQGFIIAVVLSWTMNAVAGGGGRLEAIATTRSVYVNEEPVVLKHILKDSLYGAILGLGVGGAINLIADKEAVKIGSMSGMGFLAGLAFGIYEYKRRTFEQSACSGSLACLENRRVVWNVPAVELDTSTNGHSVELHLFAYHF